MIAHDVAEKQRSCEEDLAKAEPALIAAQEALNTLNKNNLTELKSFGSPPSAVTNVTAAVMMLLSPPTKIPKDRSWKASKIMMAKVSIKVMRAQKLAGSFTISMQFLRLLDHLVLSLYQHHCFLPLF